MAPMPHADIAIGGIKVRLHCPDTVFLGTLGNRYAGFLDTPGPVHYDFDLHLNPESELVHEENLSVTRAGANWCLRRGDFHAEWDPEAKRGWIRQTASPYSLDSVLRIVHTLVLAREGGRLMHASSVVRNGRAFLFSGVSGAGKTTISRLLPADAHLLTDEMSFVRREAEGYFAYGTPFAGDLARPGENIRAPLATIFLLQQGPENRIEELGMSDAVRGILQNTLFFA